MRTLEAWEVGRVEVQALRGTGEDWMNIIRLDLKQAMLDDWNQRRTFAYRCPECGTRIQALGNWVMCKCGKMGVGGTVFAESVCGLLVGDRNRYVDGR